MSELLSLLARVTRQGPVAPLAGDTLSLSVYEYEALEPAGPIVAHETVSVAHRTADAADPAFAVGRKRVLELTRTMPPRGTPLYSEGQTRRSEQLWYCPQSRGAE